jgi:hypothetical protein
MSRFSLILAAGLMLAACQSSVRTVVTRFNSLNGPTGQTFTILPDQAQVGNLEFQNVAEQVAGALTNYGFKPVPAEGSTSDYIVFVHYGTPSARPQIVDWGPPAWPRGPYPYPAYDVYTIYSHFLDVEMVDGPAWRRGERRAVFQGRAVAESTTPVMNVVVSYLVRGLFTGFPGNNGQTVTISVPRN